MKILMKNIRTFSGEHEIDIPPITFLIGENSAGKTTLMNAISVVSNPANFPFKPDFNQQPYEMGNFNNIVTQKKGRGGSPKEFTLGYSKLYSKKTDISVTACYEDRSGVPTLKRIEMKFGSSTIVIEKKDDSYICNAEIEGLGHSKFEISLPDTRLVQRFHINELISIVVRNFLTDVNDNRDSYIEKYKKMMKAFPSLPFSLRKVISLAPIRSKPRRTYDEFKEDFNPEGGHIPFLMSRVLGDEKLSGEFKSILQAYGENSGLFDSIKTKRLGNNYADPFQVLVKKGSRQSNIVDVGYGVSQVLPIVAECIDAGEGTRILMQQPEVHLHPRAQAALGNLITILNSRKKQHYVIETHSDYLIDRIRYEVMKGNIDSKSVAIIYLEKDRSDTKVFQISVDKNGNIFGAPESYRDFFVKEQFNLLGIEGDF